MVTPQGFNALLKIVEEPPEHVKFIFATTEPDKVIGTIRSRTHHYPFRLVPPKKLSEYMEKLLAAENVPFEPGVLSFVTRAGGGSVRDSLSVLDQLIAGSGPEGLTYSGAASLLGFTDDELLDGIVEAFAARDSAAVFRQIDKVVESGSDPRRFVEDLLERLRDLIVVAAVGDGAGAVLRSAPEDQLERMRLQASSFGSGALTHAADIINAGLTEMSGATSPRLQLELMCARVLLPTIAGVDGYAARLDRMERRLDMGDLGGGGGAAPVVRAPSAPPSEASAPRVTVAAAASAPAQPRDGAPQASMGRGGAAEPGPSGTSALASRVDRGSDSPDRGGAQAVAAQGERPGQPAAAGAQGHNGQPGEPQQRPTQSQPGMQDRGQEDSGRTRPQEATPAASEMPATPATQRHSGISTDDIRRAWPDVLDRIFRIKRVTWTLLSQNAQVLEYDGERLVLGANSQGLAATMSRGQHPEVVRQALIEAIGVDVRVEARPVGPNEATQAGASSGGAPAASAPSGPAPDAPGRPQGFGPGASPTAPGSGNHPGAPGQVNPQANVASQDPAAWSDQQGDARQVEWGAGPSAQHGASVPNDGHMNRQASAAAPGAQGAPGQGHPGFDQAGAPRPGHAEMPENYTRQESRPGSSAPSQQTSQGQQRRGGWRDRTGWNDGAPNPQNANSGGAAAPGAPSGDAGLAAQAAQSSAWGSDSHADWASASGPAPDWASTDSGSVPAPVPAHDDEPPVNEPTPEWMEDEPETDVEAVLDPVPARPESDRGAPTPGGAVAPQTHSAPATPADFGADDRNLTPRQRAEKAAREAAQREEDSRRGGGHQFDDDYVSPDDEDIENSDAVGLPVIKSVLGGTVIKEEGPEGS